MSTEPGGVALGGVTVAGNDAASAFYVYPVVFDAGDTTLQLLFFTGSLGVSDLFLVARDPDVFSVAPDPDTFIVAPGRTR